MAGSQRADALGGWADDRLAWPLWVARYLRKVFPDHWSFMLGEIALWSFVVLLVTGVLLTLWFTPSMARDDVRRAPTRAARRSPCRRPTPPPCTSPSTSGAGCCCGRCTTGPRWSSSPHAHPHDAGLRHRRVPQAARGHLAGRRDDAAARRPRGLRRLLAARRPALRHRAADRRRHPQGDARGGHLPVLPPLRWRVPGRRRHPAPVRRPRAADPGSAPGAGRGAPAADRLPQAHPVARPRTDQRTWSATRSCRSTWRSRPASSSSSSVSSR